MARRGRPRRSGLDEPAETWFCTASYGFGRTQESKAEGLEPEPGTGVPGQGAGDGDPRDGALWVPGIRRGAGKSSALPRVGVSGPIPVTHSTQRRRGYLLRSGWSPAPIFLWHGRRRPWKPSRTAGMADLQAHTGEDARATGEEPALNLNEADTPIAQSPKPLQRLVPPARGARNIFDRRDPPSDVSGERPHQATTAPARTRACRRRPPRAGTPSPRRARAEPRRSRARGADSARTPAPFPPSRLRRSR